VRVVILQQQKATNGALKMSGKIAERSAWRRSTPKSPPQLIKPDRELQLPLPNDESPLGRLPGSPGFPSKGKMSTLLDRTNVKLLEMKASMNATSKRQLAQRQGKKKSVS